MSLNDVEPNLHRYSHELDELQLALNQFQRQLDECLEQGRRQFEADFYAQARVINDELSQLSQNLSEQLLVDIKDATQHRLTLLRRYLYES